MDQMESRSGLEKKVERLSWALEKSALSEYAELWRRPWHMIWLNFAYGIARGLGTAVGFTILGALLVYLLQGAFFRNLPVIGDYIADLVRIVQYRLDH
ncbi:MAG: DUF5665 domain-containing protein [Bacillota bacterium]